MGQRTDVEDLIDNLTFLRDATPIEHDHDRDVLTRAIARLTATKNVIA